jgi:hypothetical protein
VYSKHALGMVDLFYAPSNLLTSFSHIFEISSRSTSKIIHAAQQVIALSDAKSGADKLRRKMIPRGSDGTTPRMMAKLKVRGLQFIYFF